MPRTTAFVIFCLGAVGCAVDPSGDPERWRPKTLELGCARGRRVHDWDGRLHRALPLRATAQDGVGAMWKRRAQRHAHAAVAALPENRVIRTSCDSRRGFQFRAFCLAFTERICA